MSFAALKKQSAAQLQTIGKKFEQEKNGGFTKDDRFWKLDVDKTGNGYAVIRFLPAPDGEEYPYVKRFEYMVKFGSRWYVENCRSTLGEADPMNEYFFEVRGDGTDEARKTKARRFARGTNYIANIYVVDDPKHPENNGKVFLFKFGQRIFQKLEGAITPEFQDEDPFNPFDLWSGANFKLKARTLDDQRSYDKSAFDVCGPLFDDDAEMEAVWRAEYPLQPEIAPDKFKPYEELKAKLDSLLEGMNKPEAGKSGGRRPATDDDGGDDAPTPRRQESAPAATRRSAAPAAKPAAKPAEEFEDVPDFPAEKTVKKAAADDGDDDGLAAYREFLKK